jgi:uncharacterized RDD family membrane protein YckC
MDRIKSEDGSDITMNDILIQENHVPVIDTQYYASPWSRFLAFIIDNMIIQFIVVLTSTLIPVMKIYSNIAYAGVVIALGALFYFPILFFIFKNTVGGAILKIHILNNKKEGVSRFKLLFRSIFIGIPLNLGWITVSILFIGWITIFFDKKNRALHDIIFGTVVTKDRIY